MYTYIIFLDKKPVKILNDQKSDINVLKYMLSAQGNSMSYAFKWGGYSCTVTDQKTKKVSDYNK